MLNFIGYLNPIIKRIDDIEQVTLTPINPNSSKTEAEEQEHLNPIVHKLLNDTKFGLAKLIQIQQELEKAIYVIENSTGDDKNEAIIDYNRIMKDANKHVEMLNRTLSQLELPYFGKILFNRNQTKDFPKANIESYIGKFAYFDYKTKKPLITDWRAPIANLYYRNTGPADNVSFISPIGEQTGELTQKRQFEITLGKINSVYDAKTGNATADAFLLAQLNKKIGKKLTDIVSTIQDQQNSIIREDIDRPIIIQGVAGSGKTTILLHRIAYLLYSYPTIINPENSLIIAPNKMFLDYISDVLPSLGVNEINKNTYLFWAKSILGWDDKFVASDVVDDLEVKEFKGSYKFMKLIDRFFDEYEEDLFEKLPDNEKYIIKARYKELSKSDVKMSLAERVLLSAEYVFTSRQFKKRILGNFMGNLVKENERMKKVRDYIKKKTDVYTLYKEMFKFAYIFKKSGISDSFAKQLREYSLKTLGKNGKYFTYKVDDLAALVWIHFRLYGISSYQQDFIAVDEAQDLSIFQLQTLTKCTKNNNITIAGDIAQSIVPPFYIKDWNELISTLPSATKIHQLEKCYRTTIEIIDYSNRIFEKHFPKSYKLPQAVLRHGEKVKEYGVSGSLASGDPNALETLKSILVNERELSASTIAVICKNHKHYEQVMTYVKPLIEEMNIPLITELDENFHQGILVLPVEKAKGLEFDSVIIVDYDEEHYTSELLDIRLLYVAMTRALHRLHVVGKR